MGCLHRWKLLAKHNGIRNPNRVSVGRILKIPVTRDNQQRLVNLCKPMKKTVTVRRGDTLAKIAKRVLGTPKAWRYLWKNNQGVISSPHKIEVGQQLKYLQRGFEPLPALPPTQKIKRTDY